MTARDHPSWGFDDATAAAKIAMLEHQYQLQNRADLLRAFPADEDVEGRPTFPGRSPERLGAAGARHSGLAAPRRARTRGSIPTRLIAVAALAACAALLWPSIVGAHDNGHTLNVDGVGYDSNHHAGPTIHWETPGSSPTSASFAERGQTWNSSTGHGHEHLPCPGGVHWVSNDNGLQLSHCLDNPNPTTTEVTTSTTESPTTTATPTTSTSLPNGSTTTQVSASSTTSVSSTVPVSPTTTSTVAPTTTAATVTTPTTTLPTSTSNPTSTTLLLTPPDSSQPPATATPALPATGFDGDAVYWIAAGLVVAGVAAKRWGRVGR